MAVNFANDSNHNGSKAKSVNALTNSAGVPIVGGADTYSAITYAASVALDFSSDNIQSVSLVGNITFTTSNRAVTKGKVLRIVCDSTSRTLTFPTGWVCWGQRLLPA